MQSGLSGMLPAGEEDSRKVSILIKNQSFTWGVKEDEDDPKKKKEKSSKVKT